MYLTTRGFGLFTLSCVEPTISNYCYKIRHNRCRTQSLEWADGFWKGFFVQPQESQDCRSAFLPARGPWPPQSLCMKWKPEEHLKPLEKVISSWSYNDFTLKRSFHSAQKGTSKQIKIKTNPDAWQGKGETQSTCLCRLRRRSRESRSCTRTQCRE